MRKVTEVFGGRSGWTAIGAIGAIVIGAGGLITASAAPSTSPSTLVPLTPCRLLDTRPDRLVGTRNTPIGANETFTATVWGTNGNCTIPATATSVVANVVAINGSAGSVLTILPADVSQPTASMLNWVAGQAPVTNGATLSLSADGRVKINNFAGTVDLAVDITGYYAPVASTPAIAGGVEFSTTPGPLALTGVSAPHVVGSLAVTAPVAGFVIVTATTSFDSSGSTSVQCDVRTDTTGPSGPFLDVAGFRAYGVTKGFAVSAGTATISFVCSGASGTNVFDTEMTATYSPNRV